MLLTADEIYEMYSEPSSDAEMVAFARAVERAVIEKLCAGVEMPEAVGKVIESEVAPGYIDGPNGSSIWTREKHIALKVEATHDQDFGASIYTADQLRAYGAACRVKALEDAAKYLEDIHPTRLVKFAMTIRAMRGEAA